MPIKVTCPKCQGVLHAPDDAGGKRGKCPTCGTVLAIPAEAPRSVPAPAPLPEPAYRAPAAEPDLPRSSTPDVRKSSFGGGFSAKPPEPVRGSGSMNKLPAGKPADPFVKPGRPVRPASATESLSRAYRRTRRGLGVVQFALFLFLIAAVATPALDLARIFKVPIPDKNPGYLGVSDLSAAQEIRCGAVVIPAALGLLFLVLGRFGAANAPRSSYAKGAAVAAAVATLLGLIGASAFAVMTGKEIADGIIPHGLMLPDDLPGAIQWGGLATAAVFLALAEVWFVNFIGRLGAGLQCAPAVGRHTRFLVLTGLAAAVGLVLGLLYLTSSVPPPPAAQLSHPGWNEIHAAQNFWKEVDAFQRAQFAKLGEQQYAARNGLCVLAGLVVWFLYFRLVGGGRRAVREWLDVNDPM